MEGKPGLSDLGKSIGAGALSGALGAVRCPDARCCLDLLEPDVTAGQWMNFSKGGGLSSVDPADGRIALLHDQVQVYLGH